MTAAFLSTLRSQDSSLEEFRSAANCLATILASRLAERLPMEERRITSPITRCEGQIFPSDILLIPILRAGLALLPAFLSFFPRARVGFVGEKRNEETAQAELYYSNIPKLYPITHAILLDPMIATGGSASLAANEIKRLGNPKGLLLASIISASEGLEKLQSTHPDIHIEVLQNDSGLTPEKFITPGLGDFGDRYFGSN